MDDSSPEKPRILSRKTVAESRLFRVEELELRFSNGAERHFERLLGNGKGIGAVMIVAMPDPDHVLLIREYAAGFEDYVLTLPKGVVDPGEDIVTAANRELMEECGVGARRIEPLVELSLSPNYMRQRMQVMLASDLYPKRLEGDEPEPLVVETHALDSITALLAREDFHEARAIAALYIARDKLKGEQADTSLW
ncbi:MULTISPECIES: ADP compounds hydrolase NudE [Halomonas]|jgi:ADP-ribose diphosphatase|uniref:ADP compounds hydrolase NudE n=2 Tax=Halomonas TaxID=2745 RepID=A0AAU7KM95_9GAMM|nr:MULTISPECIES: ADP compounds hydrolase NudE [Halomonas]MBR9772405.1 ADP compounds hydrolase NudE [Gammaproteobacteria bacterium]KJZ12736.1 ADP-ribose diphosphatase [Halomonas sp. S2151]MAR73936.1 ADP compounds hydrolase NudE [Halomonas sp.]MBR9878431.1 ADP compounds hydrolase NudE [Gammaproteobacteria bacterium]MBS8267876.1 ADP compounds hydrolase NudE [Halomonas litopenaei]|tara:strand:+ start:1236 stop:1820 length:585 start_codon:yes stop_codon:yes gene_type:complete